MTVRFRFDRGTLRAAGFVALLTTLFLVTNTSVAAAADGSTAGAGLLGSLDVLTREGAPLSGYQLDAGVAKPQGLVGLIASGPDIDVIGHTQRMVMSGLFTLVRLLVGLCCWLIGFVFKFPLLTLLTGPAQQLADAYERHVVGALGLRGLLLGWAFIFGLILFVRGKVGTGLGEIVMTLVIAALAASAFVRPDYLLGRDGPLDQTHQAAIEVASITTSSYFDTPGRGGRTCDSAVGPAHEACVNEQAEAKTVTTPIQAALTDALVVKPYMLLQYGRVLDPKNPDDAAAYKAHVKWIKGNAAVPTPASPPAVDKEDPCGLLVGVSKTYCENRQKGREPVSGQDGFATLIKDLEAAGPVGKSAAAYAQKPTWDRVWSVIALLVAVIVVTLMIVSMAVVMLGAQGADAAAAAAGPIAWAWAMLPGPSRMLLWRWLGVFIVSALVSFMAAMALPLFGIAVDALLSDTGPDQMVERLLLVDALAVAFLVMHRRILAATAGFGTRMATRMQFSKVGGSHLRGDNSEFGAALAMHGPAGRSGILGGALVGGWSAAHGAFGARLRSLGSLAALSDGSGMPMSPGRLFGDALAEGRRGIAPLAIALRGAHTALIGPKPGTHPAAARLHSAASGAAPRRPAVRPGGGKIVADQWTGEILHDPDTDRPLLGSRIHAHASRVRAYRIGARTARFAYGATLGLPRNINRARGVASEFTDDARTQLRVAALQVREDASRWADGGRAVRDRVDHTGQAIATAWQVHNPGGAVRNTMLAAAIHTAPLTSNRPQRPQTSVNFQTQAHPQAPAQVYPLTRAQIWAQAQPQTQAQAQAQAAANRDKLLQVLNARLAAERRVREDGDQ